LWLALTWPADIPFASWETSYSAGNPPIWPAKLAIAVSELGLLVLQGLAKLLEDIAIAVSPGLLPARINSNF